MGWSCQHDYKGHCKLLSLTCEPGIKGCILKKSEYTFTTGNYEQDKKKDNNGSSKETDFSTLAKSN